MASKLSKPSKSAVDFFYKHAGHSRRAGETLEQGKRRSARELATAERHAEDHGWTYQWGDDPDGWDSIGDIDPEEIREVLAVVLLDENGRPLESLGSVVFGKGHSVEEDRRYGRMIEAELALEAVSNKRR